MSSNFKYKQEASNSTTVNEMLMDEIREVNDYDLSSLMSDGLLNNNVKESNVPTESENNDNITPTPDTVESNLIVTEPNERNTRTKITEMTVKTMSNNNEDEVSQNEEQMFNEDNVVETQL